MGIFAASVQSGSSPVGIWSHIVKPDITELLAASGCDFIVLDSQHGMGSAEDAQGSIRASRLHSVAVLVRVESSQPSTIMRALDMGAAGVIVPSVRSAAEARAAAEACNYPPEGTRSWSPMWAESRPEAQVSPSESNARVECWMMIETAPAFESRSAIAEISGITALFVGPNDLSLDLGYGRSSSATCAPLREAIRDVIDSAHRAKKLAGVYCSTPDEARYWLANGADVATVGRDSRLLVEIATDAVRRARS